MILWAHHWWNTFPHLLFVHPYQNETTLFFFVLCDSLFLRMISFSGGTFSIINQTQIIVFNGGNGSNVALLNRPTFYFEPDTRSCRNEHFFIFRNPSFFFRIKSMKHVFWHGMFRYKNAKWSTKGKESQLIALSHHGIQHFMNEWT